MIPDKRFQRAREAESMVEIKIEIKSRLHCIDIYDVDCTSWLLLYKSANEVIIRY